MKLLCLAIAFLAFFIQIDGLKVLGILPFGSNSHFAIGQAIVKSLHTAGHKVTVISPYPQKKPLERWSDIATEEILKKFQKGK